MVPKFRALLLTPLGDKCASRPDCRMLTEQEESVQSGRATYSRKKQLSLEEKCQVPTGKHEQVTGAGQGSERPAPAGPMSQWETSFGPCLGGWEFHSIVEGWPEDPARG